MAYPSLPLGGRWHREAMTEGYRPLVSKTPLRQSLRDCHLPLQGRI